MNFRRLDWLAGGFGAAYLISWQGKSLWPAVLGSGWVQWPLCVVMAVLLSTGAFLSLKTLFERPPQRLKAGLYCASFFLLFAVTLGQFAMIGFIQNIAINTVESSRQDILPGLLKQLHVQITPERRKEIAAVIYRLNGCIVQYEDVGGFVAYKPSAEDIKQLDKSRALDADNERLILLANRQRADILYILMGFIGVFVITFLIGIAITTFRLPKATSASPSTQQEPS